MPEGLNFEEFCKRHKKKLEAFGVPITREDRAEQAKLFAALIVNAEFQAEATKAEALASKDVFYNGKGVE